MLENANVAPWIPAAQSSEVRAARDFAEVTEGSSEVVDDRYLTERFTIIEERRTEWTGRQWRDFIHSTAAWLGE